MKPRKEEPIFYQSQWEVRSTKAKFTGRGAPLENMTGLVMNPI